ncbi:unnamed protein product [Cyclocybe aegerita]|uniref:F-box domain-containing protein n=1 Tax=Cyclocybe aegerita TaxID=1973307 RepID=A0A8S0WGM4_CYCAE|nr:unnamed protein product [Cyclocybe aegerita]
MTNAKSLNSPVPHLLHSNKSPSKAEAALVHTTIADAEQQLLRMRGAFQAAGARRSKMRKRLEQKATFVEQHKAILSPVRCIPMEVLEQIFFWVADDLDPIPLLPSAVPWMLGHICRWWRACALGIPKLWINLPAIKIKSKRRTDDYRTALQVGALWEQLKRSNPLPIRFILIISPSNDGLQELRHPLIDVLTDQAERWQDVEIWGEFHSLTALEDVRGRLQGLKALTLDLEPSLDCRKLDIFAEAPQLQHVECRGAFVGKILWPSNQLRSYEDSTTNLTVTGAYEMLRKASSLKRLEIYDLANPTVPTSTLSSLTVLQVRFTCIRPAEFLNNLTLPALEDLDLDWSECKDHDGTMFFALRAILSRSEVPSCLKSLRLRAGEMVDGALSPVLQLTPSLETLDVTMPFGNDVELLAHLEHRKPVLVPRLKSLEFFIPKDIPRDLVPIPKIKQLIENRCSDWDGILSNYVHLEYLLIRCVDRQHAISWQVILEGWVSDSPGDATMWFILNNNLARALPPELAEGENSRRGYHQREIVDENILDAMESIKIKTKDIQNVYVRFSIFCGIAGSLTSPQGFLDPPHSL